jgi:uncharacterized protein (DUF58 family)
MLDRATLQKVRKIQIKATKMVQDILAGQYESVFKGRGIEFEEVREYLPGDDVRSIDWNVTARMNRPYIKQFVEERELTVILVVDTSSSNIYASRDAAKSELMAELCSVLSFSAIENNDKVGTIMFSSGIEKYIPPKKGKKHVLRVTKEILDAGKAEQRERRTTSISAALDYLARVIKKRAVVFFVSDFLGENFQTKMAVMARKHDLITVRVFDRAEESIPDAGIIQMEDPETGEALLLDTGSRKFRDEYSKEYEEHRNRLKRFFFENKIDFLEIAADDDYLDKLVKFFHMRERRIQRG